MDPCLSLTGSITGSGLQGPTQSALTSMISGCKTALINPHCEVNPPRMSKREMKTLSKKEHEILDRNPKIVNLKRSESNLTEQTAASSLKNQDSLMREIKRRKVSEDSEESSTSKDSIINSSSTLLQNQDWKSINSSLSNQSSSGIGKDQNLNYEMNEEIKMHQPISVNIHSKISLNSSKSEVTSEANTNLNQKLLQKLQSLWEVFNGRLLSNEILKGRGGNDSLGFECCNKHQFIISLSALTKLTTLSTQDRDCCECWWLKCRNFIKKNKERADSMDSQIISSGLDKETIIAECPNHHRIEISYSRNYSKIWWEECLNQAREKQSREFKEQEKAEEERKQKEQQRIFQESYQEVAKEQQVKNSHFRSQKEAQYYEHIMKEVCIWAKRKMETEMSSSNFKGESTHIEIYNVYKIMYMPIEILIKTLWMIEKSLLSSHYRQLALILHPDKNKHSYANEAFLKLTKAYEAWKQLISSV